MISIATALTSAHTNVRTITRKCRSQIYPAKAGLAGRIQILGTAINRHHELQRLVGELLRAEISEKQARSIR